jgi:GTP-binding protein HflX
MVVNKNFELVGGVAGAARVARAAGRDDLLPVSAVTRENCDRLLQRLDELLSASYETVELDVANDDGALLSWLYEHGEITSRENGEAGVHVSVSMSSENRQRLEARLARR